MAILRRNRKAVLTSEYVLPVARMRTGIRKPPVSESPVPAYLEAVTAAGNPTGKFSRVFHAIKRAGDLSDAIQEVSIFNDL